jgi:hypothetical protein
MGYILPEIYEAMAKDTNSELPKVLIETGTFKGGLAHRYLEKYGSVDPFRKLYTFELGEEICQIASNRFKLFQEYKGDISKFDFHSDNKDLDFKSRETYMYDTIELINSDSVQGLKQLLSYINERCCFWLDAHAGAAKYARGPKDVPLLDEIATIGTHHIKNHLIAIDDAHLFGKIQFDKNTNEKTCDYTEITIDNVKEALVKINPNYKIEIISPYQHEMLVAYV